MPGEHVLRRDVADGTVQTDVVVKPYVTLNQTARISSSPLFAISIRPFPAIPFETEYLLTNSTNCYTLIPVLSFDLQILTPLTPRPAGSLERTFTPSRIYIKLNILYLLVRRLNRRGVVNAKVMRM
jgi:hypothetical protein